MASLHRLRVELDAGPGALGRLGRAIESIGGSIVTIDLQSISAGLAVDDVIASFPDERGEAHDVEQALISHEAGVLRAWSVTDEALDPILRSIRWACGIISAGPEGAGEEVVRVIGELCGTSDAWVLDLEANLDIEVIRMARDQRKPVVAALEVLPRKLQASFDDPALLVAVPDGRLSPRRVALVGRPAGQTFSGTEIERIEAILAVHRQVVAMAQTAPRSGTNDGPWLHLPAV